MYHDEGGHKQQAKEMRKNSNDAGNTVHTKHSVMERARVKNSEKNE